MQTKTQIQSKVKNPSTIIYALLTSHFFFKLEKLQLLLLQAKLV